MWEMSIDGGTLYIRLIGVILNLTILPLFDYNITVIDSLWVSLIFTAVSVIRGYIIRRWFNSKE